MGVVATYGEDPSGLIGRSGIKDIQVSAQRQGDEIILSAPSIT